MNNLNLFCSKITSLPPSIGRLKNLQVLDLYCTKLVTLPEEIGDLASLTKLNLRHSKITSLPPSIGRLKNLTELALPLGCVCPVTKKLCHVITGNKARSRIGLGAIDKDSVPMPPKLWPLVVCNAKQAFDDPYNILDIKQPDCIYQLLGDGRESFVGVLMNRGSKTGT